MLCDNDWISITWDGQPLRTGPENINVKFNSAGGVVRPFAEACDIVADTIATKFDNIYVALSGGCDSENVCNAFLRNRIPFTPLILHYDHVFDNSQRYEKWYADQWCRANKVVPKVINVGNYVNSESDLVNFRKLKPRLDGGISTWGFMADAVAKQGINLVTGMQLEYYPDLDQMQYLEPALGDYVGFVMQEADLYLESLAPNQHPWAFHYWNADIVASFVNAWNLDLNMQENKAAIYNVALRPKLQYPVDFWGKDIRRLRYKLGKRYGTRDVALLGTKEHLLKLLTE